METIPDYLARKHRTLINDYKGSDSQHSESCGSIAIEIAQRLLAEGKMPYIARIRGKVLDGIGNREGLVPRIYEGRVEWGAHQLACANNTAYDPMLGKSVSIDDYCSIAFEGEVEMDILVPPDRIKEFIER